MIKKILTILAITLFAVSAHATSKLDEIKKMFPQKLSEAEPNKK